MNETIDYSKLDDQPLFARILHDTKDAQGMRVEQLWPYGQKKLSVVMSRQHQLSLIDTTLDGTKFVDAIAYTPTGTFRLRYSADGRLERVRVRASDMVIHGAAHLKYDPRIRQHYEVLPMAHDAIISAFPQTHTILTQQFGFTLEDPMTEFQPELWGAGLDLPYFSPLGFSVLYTERNFSFSTLFDPIGKYAETFITNEVHLPKKLFTRPDRDMICEVGCDILGLQMT